MAEENKVNKIRVNRLPFRGLGKPKVEGIVEGVVKFLGGDDFNQQSAPYIVGSSPTQIYYYVTKLKGNEKLIIRIGGNKDNDDIVAVRKEIFDRYERCYKRING